MVVGKIRIDSRLKGNCLRKSLLADGRWRPWRSLSSLDPWEGLQRRCSILGRTPQALGREGTNSAPGFRFEWRLRTVLRGCLRAILRMEDHRSRFGAAVYLASSRFLSALHTLNYGRRTTKSFEEEPERTTQGELALTRRAHPLGFLPHQPLSL